jgi:plasmid stability protein
MQAPMCYHAFMAKQLTIRNVPEEVAERLTRLSKERGSSVNATVLQILGEAVGVEGRRARLERFVTWTDGDLAEFEAALSAQRVVDNELWR